MSATVFPLKKVAMMFTSVLGTHLCIFMKSAPCYFHRACVQAVEWQMDMDRKAGGLKALQEPSTFGNRFGIFVFFFLGD